MYLHTHIIWLSQVSNFNFNSWKVLKQSQECSKCALGVWSCCFWLQLFTNFANWFCLLSDMKPPITMIRNAGERRDWCSTVWSCSDIPTVKGMCIPSASLSNLLNNSLNQPYFGTKNSLGQSRFRIVDTEGYDYIGVKRCYIQGLTIWMVHQVITNRFKCWLDRWLTLVAT